MISPKTTQAASCATLLSASPALSSRMRSCRDEHQDLGRRGRGSRKLALASQCPRLGSVPVRRLPDLQRLGANRRPLCGVREPLAGQAGANGAQANPPVSLCRSSDPSVLTVYLGRHSQSGSNSQEESRGVQRTVCHPGYDILTIENDICLLQLSAPVSFKREIYPVCLAAAGSTFPSGTSSWVTGWGTTDNGKDAQPPGVLDGLLIAPPRRRASKHSPGSAAAGGGKQRVQVFLPGAGGHHDVCRRERGREGLVPGTPWPGRFGSAGPGGL